MSFWATTTSDLVLSVSLFNIIYPFKKRGIALLGHRDIIVVTNWNVQRDVCGALFLGRIWWQANILPLSLWQRLTVLPIALKETSQVGTVGFQIPGDSESHLGETVFYFTDWGTQTVSVGDTDSVLFSLVFVIWPANSALFTSQSFQSAWKVELPQSHPVPKPRACLCDTRNF